MAGDEFCTGQKGLILLKCWAPGVYSRRHSPTLLFVVVINTMTKTTYEKRKAKFGLLTVLHPGQPVQEPEAVAEAETVEGCYLLACLVTFLK